jgi:hypothetical protein
MSVDIFMSNIETKESVWLGEPCEMEECEKIYSKNPRDLDSGFAKELIEWTRSDYGWSDEDQEDLEKFIEDNSGKLVKFDVG